MRGELCRMEDRFSLPAGKVKYDRGLVYRQRARAASSLEAGLRHRLSAAPAFIGCALDPPHDPPRPAPRSKRPPCAPRPWNVGLGGAGRPLSPNARWIPCCLFDRRSDALDAAAGTQEHKQASHPTPPHHDHPQNRGRKPCFSRTSAGRRRVRGLIGWDGSVDRSGGRGNDRRVKRQGRERGLTRMYIHTRGQTSLTTISATSGSSRSSSRPPMAWCVPWAGWTGAAGQARERERGWRGRMMNAMCCWTDHTHTHLYTYTNRRSTNQPTDRSIHRCTTL